MDKENTKKSIEELAEEARELAKPVDFEKLEKEGLLIKEGAWYRVPNMHKLPKHVRVKVKEISHDKKGTKVKLEKASKFDKSAKKFNKII
ncbi:hypothetical protein [Desulfopila inferna]|uniref:hypothetical protein n=1 Tax=Desulfopila inferna TaxID=468528 RepID=UPI00196388F2|nr:hypothetical protein [Desulfopila inferna]MBM9605933.1 hypothetical protein [Desulfopila inferna]